MLASDVSVKLRRLNPRLRVYARGDTPTRAATVYLTDFRGEAFHELCAIPKQDVPERTIMDDAGHIVARGWRAMLDILIAKGVVDRRRAEREFGCSLRA